MSDNQDHSWKERVKSALEKRGRSARSVSLAIGRGPGYLHSVLSSDTRRPSMENMVAIADELDTPILWLLFGVDMDKDAEELLRIFSGLSESQREQFLSLARSLSLLGAGE